MSRLSGHTALLLTVMLGAGRLAGQDSALVLDSVAIEGSRVPKATVLEISGLQVAAPIDQAGIELACQKLADTGIFASVGFRYAPGANKGYAVTLTLADQAPLLDAAIDVPGADEGEAWQWLIARYQVFDRKVPQSGAAQQFLARQLEQHLAKFLRRQPLAVRLEEDFATRRLTVSFQPEVLPRIQAVAFTGNRRVSGVELGGVLEKIVLNQGYTRRKFDSAVELNLRSVYENRGFYRVRFQHAEPASTEAAMSVSVAIEEGEVYELGDVAVVGEGLPVAEMLAAAKFRKGRTANWAEIRQSLQAMENVVKRTGYYEAAARPERILHDASRVLELRVPMVKGPLYHFGELRISGLSAEMAERARRTWAHKAGDVFDYGYATEFFQVLARVVDLRGFAKYNALLERGAGDQVVGIHLVFVAR